MAIKKFAMRRLPQRQRGQKRVEAILAAAAQVFSEVGYEAATTNQIASRASTSIGSLYQFFPNKESILHALVARHRAELQALFARLLNAETIHLPAAALADRVMDALDEFGTTHTGFRQIFLHSPASPRLAAIAAELDREVIARVDEGYALRYPHLKPERRRLAAMITVTMFKALISLAVSSPTAAQPQVLAEVKAVLNNYLDLLASYERAAGLNPDD